MMICDTGLDIGAVTDNPFIRTYPYKPNFIWIGLWIGGAEPGNDPGESVSLQGFNGRSNSGTVDDPLAVQSIPPKK
jgi:hypothetical protein